MSSSPHGIYEAGVVSPGFPVKNYTLPFWLTEPSKIHKIRSAWQKTADVVIIGSGMTAVGLSRSLLASQPNLKVVVVEARELCSGATGRNGGHCKVMSPGVWWDRKEQFGAKEALRVMHYEHNHLADMAACIKEHNIQCDLHFLEGLDIYHDKKIFETATTALEDMRQHDPDLAAKYTVYTSRSDLQARKCTNDQVVGAIGMSAASLWPYKFVSGLFEALLAKHPQNLFIQTNTTVTSITDDDDTTARSSSAHATVHTTRGPIHAQHVVHATNGWLGNLLPELRPFVSPVRVNVQRQLPHPPTQRADNSYWLRYGEKDYDYMIQRPDGAFIIGRSSMGRRATADDSQLDIAPQSHLKGATPLVFDFGTKQIEVTHAWSGVVAFTEDGNPFVGRLPFEGRGRQWVCGAYQGIGMVRAFRSGQVLARLIVGGEVLRDFPESMYLSRERVRALERGLRGSMEQERSRL